MAKYDRNRTVGDLILMSVISAVSALFVLWLYSDTAHEAAEAAMFDHICLYHGGCS